MLKEQREELLFVLLRIHDILVLKLSTEQFVFFFLLLSPDYPYFDMCMVNNECPSHGS